MEPQQPDSRPVDSSSENGLVAAGRKVKAAFSSDNRPSIRIRKGNSSSNVQHARSHEGTSDGVRTEQGQPRAGGFLSSLRSFFSGDDDDSYQHVDQDEYDRETVDILDVVDPEVSTLSTLTNVQNSLFVPQLGRIVNRRATYRLTEDDTEMRRIDRLKESLRQFSTKAQQKLEKLFSPTAQLERSNSITSNLKETRYAVLPHGVKLDGWTPEQKEELDDRVRHMLHSRRSKFKRSMRGFWQYVRRPLGLFVTVYATLITLFGAAWVLFLIGWISVGSKKDYIVNVVDNVLVALFAIMGDGLAPFRAVDTYHMIYIAYYHRLTWKKREKLGLPELTDHNDLPDQRKEDVQMQELDLESLVARRLPRGLARRIAPRIPKGIADRIMARENTDNPSYEYSVLTEEQQAKLDHHARKFSKSHTFYKPHETETHYAFPLKLLVSIVLLLDMHSCLQISLGACTWGISYKTRPFALTTVILCCSITCNIMGGVLISIGDKRTRKKAVLERMYRQELTNEAMEEMESQWMKEAEERGELDPAARKRIEEQRDEEENEQIKKEWKAVPSLPKKLLGKGEDHRQPSLPQDARTAGSDTDLNLKGKKPKSEKGTTRRPIQGSSSQPSYPQTAHTRPGDDPEESTGQKIMRMIRRADFDKS